MSRPRGPYCAVCGEPAEFESLIAWHERTYMLGDDGLRLQTIADTGYRRRVVYFCAEHLAPQLEP